jgi:hypothetical protein
MKTLKSYNIIDFERDYSDIQILKDKTITSPYENYPNHKLINFNTNKIKPNIKIEIEKGFIDDYNELENDYKFDLQKVISIVKIAPIPPLNRKKSKRYQLKQFKVINKRDKKEALAFIVSLKFDSSGDNRITYMVKYKEYNKIDKTHYFTIIFFNCKSHKVYTYTYSSNNSIDETRTLSDSTCKNPSLTYRW